MCCLSAGKTSPPGSQNVVRATQSSDIHVYPANTKHLYNSCTKLDQRRRRWADVVQVLYKCFVFAGCNPLVAGEKREENSSMTSNCHEIKSCHGVQ